MPFNKCDWKMWSLVSNRIARVNEAEAETEVGNIRENVHNNRISELFDQRTIDATQSKIFKLKIFKLQSQQWPNPLLVFEHFIMSRKARKCSYIYDTVNCLCLICFCASILFAIFNPHPYFLVLFGLVVTLSVGCFVSSVMAFFFVRAGP